MGESSRKSLWVRLETLVFVPRYLDTLGEKWGLIGSDSAVVFLDNHDTQRGEAQLTYKSGSIYTLANDSWQGSLCRLCSSLEVTVPFDQLNLGLKGQFLSHNIARGQVQRLPQHEANKLGCCGGGVRFGGYEVYMLAFPYGYPKAWLKSDWPVANQAGRSVSLAEGYPF